VATNFDDAAALEYVNAIGVHHRRQTMRDQHCDDVRRR
jgi:hypothetical protein